MRHLATVQRIADLQPIEGADKIEKIKINDWWCVSEKGNFQIGDLAIYFEIDSLMPVDNPAWGFLSKGSKPKTMNVDGKEYIGYRLKTVKLRGQLSQGLALPVEVLRNQGYFKSVTKNEGDDVTEELGIVKYEPPIPAQLTGKVKGNFPGFLPKTDEERIQNCGYVLGRNQGIPMYVTEKLDGSSFTFYHHNTNTEGDHVGVCSRNLELLDTEGNTFWAMAKKYKLDEVVPTGFAVQGEVVGEGIQQNPLKLKGQDLFIYNIYDIVDGVYLDFNDFIRHSVEWGLKTVPIIDADFVFDETTSVESLLKLAEGKSLLSESSAREGIVIRPKKEMREIINGSDSRLSFKVISNEYLLKYD